MNGIIMFRLDDPADSQLILLFVCITSDSSGWVLVLKKPIPLHWQSKHSSPFLYPVAATDTVYSTVTLVSMDTGTKLLTFFTWRKKRWSDNGYVGVVFAWRLLLSIRILIRVLAVHQAHIIRSCDLTEMPSPASKINQECTSLSDSALLGLIGTATCKQMNSSWPALSLKEREATSTAVSVTGFLWKWHFGKSSIQSEKKGEGVRQSDRVYNDLFRGETDLKQQMNYLLFKNKHSITKLIVYFTFAAADALNINAERSHCIIPWWYRSNAESWGLNPLLSMSTWPKGGTVAAWTRIRTLADMISGPKESHRHSL